MATGPKLPVSALDILAPDLSKQEPVWNAWIGPVTVGGISFAGAVYSTVASGRPYFSGVHRYVLAAGIGAVIGKVMMDRRDAYLAERDALFRHYVQLHPEDFPDIKSKKFKDVFEPWAPIR